MLGSWGVVMMLVGVGGRGGGLVWFWQLGF